MNTYGHMNSFYLCGLHMTLVLTIFRLNIQFLSFLVNVQFHSLKQVISAIGLGSCKGAWNISSQIPIFRWSFKWRLYVTGETHCGIYLIVLVYFIQFKSPRSSRFTPCPAFHDNHWFLCFQYIVIYSYTHTALRVLVNFWSLLAIFYLWSFSFQQHYKIA